MQLDFIWNLKKISFTMTIIISMAGLSKRFTQAGFTLPKYMLYAHNKSLFNLSVSSFSKYFKIANFIFITRNVFDTIRFISEECKLIGLEKFEIVELEEITKGQAETVYLGLMDSKIDLNDSICIFNIDTFRKNLVLPENLLITDGFLEVFYGDGANWTYAKTETETSTIVIETAEKVQISNYCSTGLYYFKSAKLFIEAYENSYKNTDLNNNKEQNEAPIYI